MKIGFGYDFHRLVAGRPLVIGGVRIDYPKGLLGHSDADVLTHAIIDALLGAASLGDIGSHFPPGDPSYKAISSVVLLERTVKLIKEKGYNISNIDATVVCENPRLAPHIPEIVELLAGACGCAEDCVNIKAKTEEGVGATARAQAIAAYAVALLDIG
jgi:2-C-methyl-D-erythritol 2,4-cyclodiphosphate synthase